MTAFPFALRLMPAAALLGLVACANPPAAMPVFDQSSLPAPVQVPVGHRVVLETVGVGEITYECRAKANAPGAYEWAVVGPKGVVNGRNGATLGRYWGPPATWQAQDGSAITGAQVAVAPAAAGSIPLQLVKANPASGAGAMQGVSYIQRVATRGGVAPAMPCANDSVGRREIVKYQADYIFWKQA